MANRVNYIDFESGSTLLMGKGYNSLVGGEHDAIVMADDSNISTILGKDANGQNIEFEIKEIDTISTLRNELNISVSASYKALVATAQGKARFIQDVQMNSHNYFLLVRAKVVNVTETLKSYQLMPAARRLLEDGLIEEFLERCGNEFVASRVLGGEFFGIIEFAMRSMKQKQDIQAKISASGLTWKGGLEFKSAFESFIKDYSVNIYCHRLGGSGIMPINPSDFKEAAAYFPNSVAPSTNAAWPIKVTTVPYTIILDRPSANIYTLADQISFVYNLVKDRDLIIQSLNDISFAQNNPSYFPNVDINKLVNVRQELLSIRQIIDDAIKDCCDHPLTYDMSLIKYRIPEVSLGGIAPLPTLDVLVHSYQHGDNIFPENKYAGFPGDILGGFKINLSPSVSGLSMQYIAYGGLQEQWKNEGEFAGMTKEEAWKFKQMLDMINNHSYTPMPHMIGFAIKLTGSLATQYNIYYKAFIRGKGETGLFSNGQDCKGYGEVETIKVWLQRA